jgi:hypothetical protein
MKYLLATLFFSFSLLLSSCRTGVVLKETPLSISETRVAVVTVIGEPRVVSPNGRELYSKYYDRKGNAIERLELAKERDYTLVTILGDRRPYDIQVEVMIEERDEDGIFQLVDKDDERAGPIADKIKKAINQSLGSRNIIDDFRSF